ncbi:unnamed protein product [Caenorhabditis auriculariae]|uniref:Uncharacterized protein n=1 Tax=Caenorhabditis auriculariae TaxID=2777116 RepID=A0A8S1HD41_9PELO|nr:unnamed protein product [Caenorhabditis auriculariae]
MGIFRQADTAQGIISWAREETSAGLKSAAVLQQPLARHVQVLEQPPHPSRPSFGQHIATFATIRHLLVDSELPQYNYCQPFGLDTLIFWRHSKGPLRRSNRRMLTGKLFNKKKKAGLPQYNYCQPFEPDPLSF